MMISMNVRSTVTDEGVVLLDVSNGKIFHSNPIGSKVWLKLQQELPMPRIVDEVAAECNAPREQVEADVQEYIQSLKAAGLVAEQ